MMMNCFCGMVYRQKTISLISSRDHCQRSSPSRISDALRAGFEPAQNLSSGLVEWSCAVVITTTPQRQIIIVAAVLVRPLIVTFWKRDLTFIRPSPSIFSCYNPKGIKLLSRFHLREHKFKHRFQDSLNAFFSYGKDEVETSSHYLLDCSNYSEKLLAHLNTIKNIDMHILQQSDSKFIIVLPFDDTFSTLTKILLSSISARSFLLHVCYSCFSFSFFFLLFCSLLLLSQAYIYIIPGSR